VPAGTAKLWVATITGAGSAASRRRGCAVATFEGGAALFSGRLRVVAERLRDPYRRRGRQTSIMRLRLTIFVAWV